MLTSLKFKKSAGVPVTFEVHRLLTRANSARDAGEWSSAALGYRAALDKDPTLFHIWMQYGHALKETGNHTLAQVAYETAAKMRPKSAEPLLHLGHVLKEQGDRLSAHRKYIEAAKLNPQHPGVMDELQRYLSDIGNAALPQDVVSVLQELESSGNEYKEPIAHTLAETRSAMGKLASTLRRAGLVERATAIEDLVEDNKLFEEISEPREQLGFSMATKPPLVFDVSDLISYFRNARLPTGIQRVQIETITALLASHGQNGIQICAFAESRDDWVEIPAGTFINLARLSLADGNRTAPEWQTAIARLHLSMNMQEALVFPEGAYLVNLGTSWWLQNYFLFVRQAKADRNIKYVPFVHDLIPVKASEHCTKELTRDFISWIIGVFEHADYFLVNSEATKRDLISVAKEIGHEVDPDRVVVIRLDADFRKPDLAKIDQSSLAKWGLRRTLFVLFVSTIESRKNHLAAFDAWIELIRRHGARHVPKLVCVGNRGWLNDAVYSRLESHDGLKEHVIMLSGLADSELALLYDSCLFTLYPSRYEGWGLPVTESFCYGKTALLSDSSSLPEAGGEFATYFESGSTTQLIEGLEKLIFDTPYRVGLERKIRIAFRPRPWEEIGASMIAAVGNWLAREATSIHRPPLAKASAYHPIVRNFETHIWKGMRSAEIFRSGSGWWGPDDWGCWTKPKGGTLEIGLPEEAEMWRLYLRIHGLPRKASRYLVSVGNNEIAREGVLKPGVFKWLTFDVPHFGDHLLRVRIEGAEVEDLAEVTNGLDRRHVSVGVCGFFVCAGDDHQSRSRFLEAVALGNIDDIVFNQENSVPVAAPSLDLS